MLRKLILIGSLVASLTVGGVVSADHNPRVFTEYQAGQPSGVPATSYPGQTMMVEIEVIESGRPSNVPHPAYPFMRGGNEPVVFPEPVEWGSPANVPQDAYPGGVRG